MKIESNAPSIAQPVSAPSKTKGATKTGATAQMQSTQKGQSTQKRIQWWFSQAGIQDDPSLKTSQDQKISRKQEILARRKFTNLENILSKALDFCLDSGADEELDPDWFFSFVNMAEDIYSPAMQELWGKIFAVETARPGSFSLKTLGLLKQLTQKDAQIFRNAVNLSSIRKGESSPKILVGYYQKPSIWSFFSAHKEHRINLAEFGLSYPDLLSLMDLGLIHQSEIESGELPFALASEWRCAGQNLSIMAKRSGTTLVYFKFTTTGAELCKLVTRKKQDIYLKALQITLEKGFTLG